MQIPWTDRKTNKWVLDQIKHELSLEAKRLKFRLSNFGHIMSRQQSKARCAGYMPPKLSLGDLQPNYSGYVLLPLPGKLDTQLDGKLSQP